MNGEGWGYLVEFPGMVDGSPGAVAVTERELRHCGVKLEMGKLVTAEVNAPASEAAGLAPSNIRPLNWLPPLVRSIDN